MNQSGADHSENSELERIIKFVSHEFHRRFLEDSEFRIEDLLEDIRQYFDPIVPDQARDDAKNRTIAELIFVEMGLRFTKGEEIDVSEYLTRFPDFGTAITGSLELLADKTPDARNFSTFNSTRIFRATEDENLDFEFSNATAVSVPHTLGTYSEITQLNSGSFGIVCRAKDNRDGRIVALKFPRRDRLKDVAGMQMFIAEANKAKKLEHPGIVRTYSIETFNGFLAIVQQYVDGTDLKTAKEKLDDKREIANLIANVADALAYAHRQGVYHRDLKPANILVDTEGRPFVVDFGLAIDDNEQIYLPRQRCGTAFYMPPEQVAGLTRLIDGRSDIWSLGVVLYELLTKQKPFRGVTDSDIFYQIENKDPRPPRQIDDSISPELQRICLKCLERQQRHRYPTAGELADDLRHWVKHPTGTLPGETAKRMFLPKGLRSYSAEDADFFLDLLPGPRDRDGLTESILFWKRRICESSRFEAKVPVGIIFGPSGSGKSSFVKAGLLSNIGDDILFVYVEATAVDTEARILKSFTQTLESVPDDISLPELFRGLSKGTWTPNKYRKILLVIDQFEQRLSQGDHFPSSQLVKALRHCEGENLQCLLLSRDDFMMAISRFFDALEMDFREGENAQAIDLFDRKHARMILAKLGRAFEQLPDEPTPLSAEQDAFLDEAVKQLATENQVICVQLVLFAEMFRHRPWTFAELNSVGGVEGTGERFLETTFGPHSHDKRFRLQRESAQRVLQALLPAMGTDIRGAMKPERELLQAARMEESPELFRDLVGSLDGRLKLITRTDPDKVDQLASDSRNSSGPNFFYQLTHDYLVPSIRNWLMREKKSSRSGRAELTFLDKASEWNRSPDPRRLLTTAELFNVFRYRKAIPIAANHKAFFDASLKHNGWVVGLRSLVLCSIFALALLLVRQVNEARNDFIRKSVDSLIAASTPEQIMNELNEVQRLGSASVPEIRQRLIEQDLTEVQQTVLRVAMHRLAEEVSLKDLLERALEADLFEFALIRNELKLPGDSSTQPLWKVVRNEDESTSRQLRACCLLAKWEPESVLNNESPLPFVSMLTSTSPADCDRWIEFLEPINEKLVKDINDFLDNCVDAEQLQQTDLDQVKQQAFACLLLFHLHTPAPFHIALMNQVDPTLCTQMVHSPYNRLLSDQDIKAEINSDTLILNAKLPLIQILGQRGNADAFGSQFLDQIRQLAEGEANASFYASAVWALQNCGLKNEAARLSKQLTNREILVAGAIFQDGLGHEMVTVQFEFDSSFANRLEEYNETAKTRRLIAFCSVEESNDILKLWSGRTEEELAPGLPVTSLSPNEIMKYCNWLSEQAGIDPSQYCYEINENGIMACKENFLELTGYRLPLRLEWELASSSNSKCDRYFGWSTAHMPAYAWYQGNANGQIQPCSQLIPNSFGLFDTLGNCWEWTHFLSFDREESPTEPKLVLCGGGANGNETVVTSDEIILHRQFDPNTPMPYGSFRVVRTLQFNNP